MKVRGDRLPFLLLERFRALFEGTKYVHRDSSLGDSVAVYLTEDLYALHKSQRLDSRIEKAERVQNIQNKRRGINARRGDGTFGELIPGAMPIQEEGYKVARGPIATVEIGVEVKILCKAMVRQIDRVMQNMEDQVKQFRLGGGQPLSVCIVGINHAQEYVSYEGDREWPTTGRGRHKHPYQEAAEVEARIKARVASQYDDVLFLRFRATNMTPFKFEWLNGPETELDYGAVLTRTIRGYEQRFG
jgi:hypothetical protein